MSHTKKQLSEEAVAKGIAFAVSKGLVVENPKLKLTPNGRSLMEVLLHVDGEEKAKRTLKELNHWKRYHIQHPQVWRAIVKKAESLDRSERKKYGISAVTEGLRYDSGIPSTISDEEDFAISNDFKTVYVRMLTAYLPFTREMFTLKPSRFDGCEPWHGIGLDGAGLPTSESKSILPALEEEAVRLGKED